MTREEIIEHLKNIDIRFALQEQYDALCDAIEILEQPTAEDCVSRAEIMKLIDDILSDARSNGHAVGVVDLQWFALQVNAIPSVTPTRHHGEWEETVVLPRAYDIMGNKTWASQMRCNKCEFATFAVEGKFSQYNFCPNCGADMREVKTDADSD